MATRTLVTRVCIPASSSLRRHHPVPKTLAEIERCLLLGCTPTQDDLAFARELLKKAKRQDEVMRIKMKWFPRVFKAMEWTCYLIVSATVGTALMDKKP
ncbi:hypothetical protein BS78_02G044200 [Paspalum vaginatum]|uniref:Uncharacterized protein n=1 Tax=Paspalum vaginatum TaxID=158149 RepID=A0A9W7X9Y1_9POAL|nr:hypothetical protein BS78_K324600 [Paspalum vaginatum]KAJ1287874.1 hypothetical protein BS78_02G044200 [Paspalum vaginatum]